MLRLMLTSVGELDEFFSPVNGTIKEENSKKGGVKLLAIFLKFWLYFNGKKGYVNKNVL